ncbi:hypothetical protein [Legionella feeleii]|uniref:Outer membrane protein beta-barrel domain-containing protein n=1 Tax=Legionella feeleii TaxID=453 RepID=A0A0W0TMS2_9GAMM|nr:hypothetical protein [Legionella feeleii]KTC96813.1 hypothetical protein Lfee_1725 [Legionella feeleii]SPX60953.1 Uncharacterised protein [Legionella feeleii]
MNFTRILLQNIVSRTVSSVFSIMLLIAGSLISMSSLAGGMNEVVMSGKRELKPWSITGSLGYTDYQNMYKADGQTGIGRFALGRDLLIYKQWIVGLEIGIQNGNDMRLGVSQATLDELGGLPIQSTVKPVLDVLATLEVPLWNTSALSGQLKGGVAYRRWQFNNRVSINDKSQLAGEVQAGLGYSISECTSLSLLYQGIFGSNPDFRVNALQQTGQVANIPVQHGVLLGFSVRV